MRHVFVESNWVFSSCAPRHLRSPFAELLLQKARAGELRLHLPAICLREGGDAIRPLSSLYAREGVWVYGDFAAVAGAP
jgi:hypothetical protein